MSLLKESLCPSSHDLIISLRAHLCLTACVSAPVPKIDPWLLARRETCRVLVCAWRPSIPSNLNTMMAATLTTMALSISKR